MPRLSGVAGRSARKRPCRAFPQGDTVGFWLPWGRGGVSTKGDTAGSLGGYRRCGLPRPRRLCVRGGRLPLPQGDTVGRGIPKVLFRGRFCFSPKNPKICARCGVGPAATRGQRETDRGLAGESLGQRCSRPEVTKTPKLEGKGVRVGAAPGAGRGARSPGIFVAVCGKKQCGFCDCFFAAAASASLWLDFFEVGDALVVNG